MSGLRQAAQQALEALYESERLAGSMAYPAAEVASAITALRAALADGDNVAPTEPVQEPVAWRYVPSDVWGDAIVTQDPKTVELAQKYGRPVEPLYTAPPQRPAEPVQEPVADQTCTWSQFDDEYNPDTWRAPCGAVWTFTDGGPADNRLNYCPNCGKRAVESPAESRTDWSAA